jgi:hypothetical protein
MKKHARVEKIDEIIDHLNAPAHKIETLKCIGRNSIELQSSGNFTANVIMEILFTKRVVIALISDTSCHSATVIRCKTYHEKDKCSRLFWS